jgi:hypothetical protein
MSATLSAEIQSKLLSSLKDIVDFFVSACISSRSIQNLNDLIDKNQTMAFLELAEAFGECMAFIDHDDLLHMLQESSNLLADFYSIERKNILKKLKFLKEDKKSDQAVVERNETNLVDVEAKKAFVVILCLRLRTMLEISIRHFKEDANFDCSAHYQKLQDEKRMKT